MGNAREVLRLPMPDNRGDSPNTPSTMARARIYPIRPRLIGRRILTRFGPGTVIAVSPQLRDARWMVSVKLDRYYPFPGFTGRYVDVLLPLHMTS
jgi:hypothetical protein